MEYFWAVYNLPSPQHNYAFCQVSHIYPDRIEAQICVETFNSDSNNKDVINVDHMVTGGEQKVSWLFSC